MVRDRRLFALLVELSGGGGGVPGLGPPGAGGGGAEGTEVPIDFPKRGGGGGGGALGGAGTGDEFVVLPACPE